MAQDTEARFAGRKRATFRSAGLQKYLKSQCPLPISSVSSDDLADVSSDLSLAILLVLVIFLG